MAIRTKPRSQAPQIVIVGAGRSGTTMVKEALQQHRDVAAFEFEMNHLWRYGNERLPHDALDPALHFSVRIKERIEREYRRTSQRQGRPRVLDKTVANVMRLRYVQAVLPNAKILHVLRDGRAVAASAARKWRQKSSSSYYLSKLRTVPARSVPTVVVKNVSAKAASIVHRRGYRTSWGARWNGIDRAVSELPLVQLCARQWVQQVRAALSQAGDLTPSSYREVRYESLVADPHRQFRAIRDFLELARDRHFDEWVKARIESNRTNRWVHQLSELDLQRVLFEQKSLLTTLGYV